MREVPEKGLKNGSGIVPYHVFWTACFESYIWNHDSALAQAQTGIDLFGINRDTSSPITSDDLGYALTTTQLVDSDLVGIFALLEDFVVMFRDSSQTRKCSQAIRPTSSVAFRQTTSSFKSLKEAKHNWDLIIAWALRWRKTLGEGLLDFLGTSVLKIQFLASCITTDLVRD